MAPKRKSAEISTKSTDGDITSENRVAKKRKSESLSIGTADTPKPAPPSKINKVDTDLNVINFSCVKTNERGENANFKVVSWNVAGLRACIRKNGLEYIQKEDADIVCLQEIKCSESKLPPEVDIPGYHKYWHLSVKEGYAGVGLYSKEEPLNVKYGLGNAQKDLDGRVVTAEYDKFYLVNAYVPNAGRGLKNLPERIEWDQVFRKYLKSLDEKKPVVLVGDLNVSHKEIGIHAYYFNIGTFFDHSLFFTTIDLANPKTNVKSAGFSQEERDGMTALLDSGFVDSFRELYPEKSGAYSFWTYLGNSRARNVGWRLDYFVVSGRFMSNVCDNVMRTDVYGSDHCPIVLYLSI